MVTDQLDCLDLPLITLISTFLWKKNCTWNLGDYYSQLITSFSYALPLFIANNLEFFVTRLQLTCLLKSHWQKSLLLNLMHWTGLILVLQLLWQTLRVHLLSARTSLLSSVWTSSYKTGKRPRPDRTKTDQDRRFSRPIKTVTAVRSSVPCHFKIFKTDKNRSQPVSTGFYSLKSSPLQGEILQQFI